MHGDGRDPQAARKRDPQSARKAVHGANALIAVIGPASRTGPHQVAEVAAALLTAMGDEGARRLVITSAYPLVADRPRVAITRLRRIYAAAYADAAAMERAVSGSSLDWTIARLNRLTNKPAIGQARITRADAARVLLDITEDQALARTVVNIAGPARRRTP